ncbi:MAG: heavy-metal-associated domain-containing protein [Chloroflexota bacterium]|nr:MAG: hypothetical protein DLM70_10535 [Chloroflexota bacterium]
MKRLKGNPLAVGLGGAVVASLCCATPVVLVTLGLATSSVVVAWLNLKPLFLALAAVFVTGGLLFSLLRSKRSCSRRNFRRCLGLYPVVTLVSFAIGFWLLMDVATPRLYQQVYAADRASVSHMGTVLEPNGQVVALRRAAFKIYMGCEGCASTLRTVFLGLPGVHAAAIDNRHRQALVVYDPSRISARTLEAKIPYPWYYTPHLSSDVAMAVGSASASTIQQGSMAALLAVFACLLASTSAAVWTTTRRTV